MHSYNNSTEFYDKIVSLSTSQSRRGGQQLWYSTLNFMESQLLTRFYFTHKQAASFQQ
jgi:hypothetical protein